MYYINITTLPKSVSVDTTKLRTGELIHMDFHWYNVTSIQGFTSMLTIVCAKTRILRVFPTTYKIFPLRIICLILKTFKNEKHTCRRVRFDGDCALSKSTDITHLLVDEFRTAMETTGGNVWWININNKWHSISVEIWVVGGARLR